MLLVFVLFANTYNINILRYIMKREGIYVQDVVIVTQRDSIIEAHIQIQYTYYTYSHNR